MDAVKGLSAIADLKSIAEKGVMDIISAPLSFDLEIGGSEVVTLKISPQRPVPGVWKFTVPVSGTLETGNHTTSIAGELKAHFDISRTGWKLTVELDLDQIKLKTSKPFRRSDSEMMLEGEVLLSGQTRKANAVIPGAEVKRAIPAEKLWSKFSRKTGD